MLTLSSTHHSYSRPAGVAVWVVLLLVAAAGGVGGGIWTTRYLIRSGHWSAGAASGDSGAHVHNDDETGAADDEQWYTCGMHPNVLQKGPGDCPICQMKLTPLSKESSGGGGGADSKERKVLYWRAPMNPSFISQKPGKSPMGMDLVPVYADASQPATGKVITVAPETIQNMGVRTTTVKRGPLVKTIRTLGRVDYDEQTVNFINTKFDGYIEKLYVDETGMQVRKGQPLFDVYSPKLYSAQTEYLVGLRGVESMAKSTLPGMLKAAQRTLEASRIQLQYFDVSDEQIARLRDTKEIQKNVTIHSPAEGVVTEKMALEGMYIKPGMSLYTIADLSRVWVYVDIYEYQLPWVRIGQQARMTLSYIPGKAFTGRVVYIYPYLEKQSRVIKVRLEFENPALELKPEMYANVILEADLKRDALLIPREAYIDSGTRKVAFVSLNGGRFEPRDIQVGVETESGAVEVLYGLDAGESVVTSGQFMLDAESKLREAVAKMMAAKSEESAPTGDGMKPGMKMGVKPEGDAPDLSHAGTTQPSVAIPPDAKFACPMPTHPDESDPAKRGPYFAAEDGDCPRCGMALKPIAELDWVQARLSAGDAQVGYTCPDHPHVLSDKGGTCPRCGKPLEPFKQMYTCPDPAHSSVVSAQAGTCPHCGRELAPFRGVWLSPDMADMNMPPRPELADSAQYHCPIHPLVHSDKPGQCTICGRALESSPTSARVAVEITPGAAAAASFVCPMHPEQVRADKPGVCSICGMSLVHLDSLPHVTTAPAAVTVQMNYLMEHYLEIQKRLASDRTAGVAQNALGLVSAADQLAAKMNEPGLDLPKAFGEALERLRKAALKTDGKSLDDDRATFVELSAAMRALVELARPDKQRFPDIYLYHCPMSKGDWLQNSRDMANPYYGFKMLKCGDLISAD